MILPAIGTRLLAFGPGLVFALSAVGPGDLASNSTIGANFGVSLIWSLLAVLLFRYVWLRVSARYVLVTGKSLLQGYLELGKWLLYVLLVGTLLTGHFGNLYTLLFSGQAAQLILPLPVSGGAKLWALILAGVGFPLVFAGGYPLVEKACTYLIALLGGSLLVAAIASKPDLSQVLMGTFVPSWPAHQSGWSVAVLVAALVGTEAGAVSNVMYSYLLREKGWLSVADLPRQRWDLIFSLVCVFMAGAMLQIVAAGTLLPRNQPVENTQDLVALFSHSQGRLGGAIFAVGFWATSFSSFLGFTMGYSLMVADMCRLLSRKAQQGLEDTKELQRRFYRWAVAFFILSPLYFLGTEFQAVVLAVAVSAAYTVLIPLLTLGLLWMGRRAQLGEHRIRGVEQTMLWGLIGAACWLCVRNFRDWMG